MDLEQKIQKAIGTFHFAEENFTAVKKSFIFTGGKDSTVMVDLARRALGEAIPPALYIDSGLDSIETEKFIMFAQNHWGFDLIPLVHYPTLDELNSTRDGKKRESLFIQLRLETIKIFVEEYGYRVLFMGAKLGDWAGLIGSHSPDENCQFFYPLSHFTEKDVWEYIDRYKIPYNPLYDRGLTSLSEQNFLENPLNEKNAERVQKKYGEKELKMRMEQIGYR